MDVNVRANIKGFYVTKKYKGGVFPWPTIRKLFQISRSRGVVDKFIRWVPKPALSVYQHWEILECFLIERNYALEYFSNSKWHRKGGYPKNWMKYLSWITPRLITGTGLYVFHPEEMPFWKDPHYGYDKPWIHTDIEEHHISKKLKDYDQVIEFLNLIKKDL